MVRALGTSGQSGVIAEPLWRNPPGHPALQVIQHSGDHTLLPPFKWLRPILRQRPIQMGSEGMALSGYFTGRAAGFTTAFEAWPIELRGTEPAPFMQVVLHPGTIALPSMN
jgi:hypothetical protein